MMARKEGAVAIAVNRRFPGEPAWLWRVSDGPDVGPL